MTDRYAPLRALARSLGVDASDSPCAAYAVGSNLMRELNTPVATLKNAAAAAAEGPAPVSAAPKTDVAANPDAAPKNDAMRPAPNLDPLAAEPIITPLDTCADRPLITDPSPRSQLEGEEEMSLGWTLVRTLLVLGVVVMVIYISLNFGLRKMMGLKAPGAPSDGSVVSVVERVPLDQKRALFVVKAAGEYLLLGGTDTSLDLRGKLDGAEVDRVRALKPQSSLTLSPLLTKLLSRRAGERK